MLNETAFVTPSEANLCMFVRPDPHTFDRLDHRTHARSHRRIRIKRFIAARFPRLQVQAVAAVVVQYGLAIRLGWGRLSKALRGDGQCMHTVPVRVNRHSKQKAHERKFVGFLLTTCSW